MVKDLTRAIAMPAPEGGTTADEAERRFAAAGVMLAGTDQAETPG